MGSRPEHEHLDDDGRAFTRLGGRHQPVEERAGRGERGRAAGCRVVGEQDARQGDVLVLVQVGQLVGRRDPPAARPGQRLGHLAGGGEHPRAYGIHRAHLRREVGDVDPLRLLEQPERGGRVALRGPHLGQGDPPAVGVLGQAGRLTELLGPAQLLSRSGQVAAGQRHPAQLHVQVGRSPQRRRRRDQRERLTAAALGVAQPPPGQVDVGQRHGAARARRTGGRRGAGSRWRPGTTSTRRRGHRWPRRRGRPGRRPRRSSGGRRPRHGQARARRAAPCRRGHHRPGRGRPGRSALHPASGPGPRDRPRRGRRAGRPAAARRRSAGGPASRTRCSPRGRR